MTSLEELEMHDDCEEGMEDGGHGSRWREKEGGKKEENVRRSFERK